MVDLYRREQAYERIKEGIAKWDAPEENKKHIRAYLASRIEHLSPGRKYSDLGLLKQIFHGTQNPKSGKRTRAPLIRKALSAMTLEDFEELRNEMQRTIRGKDQFWKIKAHIKNIMLDRFEDDPSKAALLQKLFSTGQREFFKYSKRTLANTSVSEEHFYTEDEFLRLLAAARRPQERALLALAWESTSRPNEYLSLKVRDVEELPQGFKIKAHISKKTAGETTTRNLYVFTFRADFNSFWQRHHHRNNPDGPLFYREDAKAFLGQSLGPAGANKIIKQLDHKSGIKKNGTLYFLRHGGYTAKVLHGMNPALAGRDMGWAASSKQAKRYLHLTEQDVLNERLRLAGEHYDKVVKKEVKVRICPWCNASNSPMVDRCEVCGQQLSVDKIAKEMQEQKERLKALEDALFQLSKRDVRELLHKSRSG